MNSLRAYIFVGLLLGQAACVTTPYDGQILKTKFDSVFFYGFAYDPKADVTILVLNNGKHLWEVVGKTTAGETPISVYGQQMYVWSITAAISSEQDLVSAACRWHTDCNVLGRRTATEARVKVKAGLPLLAFDEASHMCLVAQVEKGLPDGLLASYVNCRKGVDSLDIIHLRAPD